MSYILVIFGYCVLISTIVYCDKIDTSCTSGRFSAVRMGNCKGFYYCIEVPTGSFYAVKYECPVGESFYNAGQRCLLDGSFNCDESASDTIFQDKNALNHFQCPAPGHFPDTKSYDCKTYYTCSLDGNNELVGKLVTCLNDTLFSWDEKKCVSDFSYECPNFVPTMVLITNSIMSQKTNFLNEFICPSAGRYENTESSDCRDYYLCTVSADATIKATLTQCPSTTVFSPDDKKCVKSSQYQCPAQTKPVEATSTTIALTPEVGYQCPGIGQYPHEESPECNSYYVCTLDVFGDLIAVLTDCPQSTIFSWDENKCVSRNLFTCPNTELKETTTLPSTSIVSTTQTVDYKCTGSGSYPNKNSHDCTTYYLCLTGLDGFLFAVIIGCPELKIFSWDTRTCVSASSYICPNQTPPSTKVPEITMPTTTIPISSTTIFLTTSPSESITTTWATTSTLFQTTSIAYSSTSISSPSYPEQNMCKSAGRYPNLEQPDCQSYNYCIQTANGNFLKYTFKCPAKSFFDPVKQSCSTNYECPHVPTDVTTEVDTTLLPFNCTRSGRFPNLLSSSCESYVYCMKTTDGKLLTYVFKCPASFLFSPNEGRCSLSHECKY
ncbi:uncharacterized protein LOC131425137 [Malaya genurostris]|uniref:uncharacterized protein LOC131425137 n=1 Tax=Malaya genurostris TaxID=325434 RepID=UPI0026F3F405|nr:uncharacterized protein LOC131425137 [Malaya genurostris]